MSFKRLHVILNHLQTIPVCRHVKSHFSVSTSHYMYTVDNNILTDKQRQFYEKNGFLVIPKLVENELLDECIQKFVDICNGKISKGEMILMKDKSLIQTNKKGEFLYHKLQDIAWEEVFSKYVLHPTILRYVQGFTGPDITAFHSMVINKPPDCSKMTSAHLLHQDLHYFPFRPADRIVGSWTAMEKINVDNGCLYVLPGTHKGSLQSHDYPENEVNKAFHGLKGFDQVPRLNLVMEKGDTVFFHPLLMHGSGPNLTKGFRKVISCHYASNHCHFIDVKGTTQEKVAREVEAMSARRGMNVPYVKYIRLRQRVVTGNPGTFNIDS